MLNLVCKSGIFIFVFRYPPEVGALLSFEKLESSLHRIRRNHQNKKHLKSADNTDWELEEGNR